MRLNSRVCTQITFSYVFFSGTVMLLYPSDLRKSTNGDRKYVGGVLCKKISHRQQILTVTTMLPRHHTSIRAFQINGNFSTDCLGWQDIQKRASNAESVFHVLTSLWYAHNRCFCLFLFAFFFFFFGGGGGGVWLVYSKLVLSHNVLDWGPDSDNIMITF